jgi:hypothetical protein
MADFIGCIITTRLLPKRTAHITSLLSKLHDPAPAHRFVTCHEPDEIQKSAADNGMCTPQCGLRPPQISNALKHVEAISWAAEQNNPVLVLEDDCILATPDASSGLRQLLAYLANPTPNQNSSNQPHSCYICFLGLPTRADASQQTPVTPLDPRNCSFLMVNAYIVSPAAAAALKQAELLPITTAFHDHLRQVLCRQDKVACFRSKSPMLVDGSKYAYFTSSLMADNRLIFNPHFVKAQQLVASGPPTDETLTQLQTLTNDPENIVASHPDFLTLISDLFVATKRYDQARALLQRALDYHLSNSLIVNNDSNTLTKLIRLHRYLQ